MLVGPSFLVYSPYTDVLGVSHNDKCITSFIVAAFCISASMHALALLCFIIMLWGLLLSTLLISFVSLLGGLFLSGFSTRQPHHNITLLYTL